MSLFKGIAIVIDDELGDAGSGIATICSQIETAGGYIVGLKDLPAKDADLANFTGASFFLVDWDLIGAHVGAPAGDGVAVPAALKREKVNAILDFLDRLKQNRYVPVFIFTNEDVDAVKTALGKRAALYQVGQPSHIFVKSKDEVITDGVIKVLNDWVNTVPSALVLKRWEGEYERAKNALFADFYANSIYWPVVLWQTFEEDGVPGSDELGRLISRNLLSRMTPFDMEMTEFVKQLQDLKDHDPKRYRQDLMKVLEGERLVRNDRLHDERVATGDVFKMGGDYYVNIRPDCDCIPRGGVVDPELYLLKGTALGATALESRLERDRGLLSERDDEAIVFAIHEGRTVSFKLKEIRTKKWSEMKDKRVGRLLPPFSIRVQQRYAAYLQRPGIPKIPVAAMPDPPASAAGAVDATPGSSPHLAPVAPAVEETATAGDSAATALEPGATTTEATASVAPEGVVAASHSAAPAPDAGVLPAVNTPNAPQPLGADPAAGSDGTTES